MSEELLSIIGIFLFGLLVLWILTILCKHFPEFGKFMELSTGIGMLVYAIITLNKFNKLTHEWDKFEAFVPVAVFSVLTTSYIIFAIAEVALEKTYEYTEREITIESSDRYSYKDTDVYSGFIKNVLSFLLFSGIFYIILYIIGYKILLIGGLIVSIISILNIVITFIKAYLRKHPRNYY